MPVNSCRTAGSDRGSVSPCRTAGSDRGSVSPCRTAGDVNLCRGVPAPHGGSAALNDSDAAALAGLR